MTRSAQFSVLYEVDSSNETLLRWRQGSEAHRVDVVTVANGFLFGDLTIDTDLTAEGIAGGIVGCRWDIIEGRAERVGCHTEYDFTASDLGMNSEWVLFGPVFEGETAFMGLETILGVETECFRQIVLGFDRIACYREDGVPLRIDVLDGFRVAYRYRLVAVEFPAVDEAAISKPLLIDPAADAADFEMADVPLEQLDLPPIDLIDRYLEEHGTVD